MFWLFSLHRVFLLGGTSFNNVNLVKKEWFFTRLDFESVCPTWWRLLPPFHPSSLLTEVSTLRKGTSVSPDVFSVSTISNGYAWTIKSSRKPDCTWSRAEEFDKLVTQSIATPEPPSRTIPTLGRALVAHPHHVATTCPYRQPGSSSFASHWRFLPRRLDGAVARR